MRFAWLNIFELRLTPFNNSYNLSKHPIVLLPWETCESPRQKERKILQQIVIASTRKFSGRPWFSASLRCHNPANCVQITSGPTFAKRKGSPTACVPSLFVSNVLSLAPKVDELRRAVMHANLDLVRITELWLTRHIHDKVFALESYNIIRRDRTQTEHGGMCVYIKNTLKFTVVDDLGRVRLGSIRNKNNWNNASRRLLGSYSHCGIPGFPFRLFCSQEQNSRNIFRNIFWNISLFRNIPNERALRRLFFRRVMDSN